MNFFDKIFNKKRNYEEQLLKQYGYANKLKKYNLKIFTKNS